MAPKQTAAAALRRAIPEDDPLWQTALRAPIDDGPVPEQERLAMEEAAKTCRFTDGEVVTAMIDARRHQ